MCGYTRGSRRQKTEAKYPITRHFKRWCVGSLAVILGSTWEHVAYLLGWFYHVMLTLSILLPLMIVSYQIATLKCLKKIRTVLNVLFFGLTFLVFFLYFDFTIKNTNKIKPRRKLNLLISLFVTILKKFTR